MPSDKLQHDEWVSSALAFATRTVELRRMHPGSGKVGKRLMLLVHALNRTLRGGAR